MRNNLKDQKHPGELLINVKLVELKR